MEDETQVSINELSGLSDSDMRTTYMLTWFSAHGVPRRTYYNELNDAKDHFDHLIEVGRQPKLWLDLTPEETPIDDGSWWDHPF
jgi:hypothetical protein